MVMQLHQTARVRALCCGTRLKFGLKECLHGVPVKDAGEARRSYTPPARLPSPASVGLKSTVPSLDGLTLRGVPRRADRARAAPDTAGIEVDGESSEMIPLALASWDTYDRGLPGVRAGLRPLAPPRREERGDSGVS